jgi:hypothetical protein
MAMDDAGMCGRKFFDVKIIIEDKKTELLAF